MVLTHESKRPDQTVKDGLLLSLRHIKRRFQVGDEWVNGLDDVCLDINAGDYLSIMGPSGSGKSTLLNVLGLLDKADEGEYLFNREVIGAASESRLAQLRSDKIGFVFQAFHLIPRLTAAENIVLPLMLAGVGHQERKTRLQQVLNEFDLNSRAQHRPDQLSGGQRQRVAIARATISRPTVLLADEPTGNLDYHSSLDVISLLESLNQQGITLLVVTHDRKLGERADRVIQMIDGKIIS